MLIPGRPFSSATPQGSFHMPSSAGTVLVVDDEQIIRRMVQNMLQHFGYTVLSAENGQHAIEVLATCTQSIDVMILDLSMPVMNGHTALEHIWRICPDLKVVISSGLDEANVAESFILQPVAGFIQKPYNVQTLIGTVSSLMPRCARTAGHTA